MCQHFPFLFVPWLVAPTTFATQSASNFAASLSCHDKRFLLFLLHVTPPADPHLPHFLFRSGRAQHLLNNKFRMSGVRLKLENALPTNPEPLGCLPRRSHTHAQGSECPCWRDETLPYALSTHKPSPIQVNGQCLVTHLCCVEVGSTKVVHKQFLMSFPVCLGCEADNVLGVREREEVTRTKSRPCSHCNLFQPVLIGTSASCYHICLCPTHQEAIIFPWVLSARSRRHLNNAFESSKISLSSSLAFQQTFDAEFQLHHPSL